MSVNATHNTVADMAPEFLVMPILGAMLGSKDYDLIMDYRLRLANAVNQLESETPYVNLARFGLLFMKHTKRCPGSVKAIQEFFTANPSLVQNSGRRDGIRLDLEAELEAWEEAAPELKTCDDLGVHIIRLIEVGQQKYHATIHRIATTMAEGTLDADFYRGENGDLLELPLHERARVYLSRAVAADPFKDTGAKGIQGDTKENLAGVSINLDAALIPKQGSRLLTGIKEIDEDMNIGPSGLKYIGLLGYLNSGKSTLLKSMLLEFARQGASVLFVPREENAEQAMASLIWANAYDHNIKNMPSLVKWYCAPKEITAENQIAKDEAMDVFNNLPGKIEVVEMETLTDILEHYETYKARKQYTVLAIDYVAHLAVIKERGESEQDAHKRDFQTLQQFALREKVVTITPLQSNRDGMKAALAGDAGDEGVFVDCNAVEWFSAASQGMDVVIGCWYSGDLKEHNVMRLSCPKKPRFGKGFQKIDLYVDPTSRRCRETTKSERTEIQDQETARFHEKLRQRQRREDRAGARGGGSRGYFNPGNLNSL